MCIHSDSDGPMVPIPYHTIPNFQYQYIISKPNYTDISTFFVAVPNGACRKKFPLPSPIGTYDGAPSHWDAIELHAAKRKYFHAFFI